MTATYTPLATVTLGSSLASITFGSIPTTYRDLVLVARYQMSGTAGATMLRANGDTGANYNVQYVVGTGSAAQAAAEFATGRARVGGSNVGTTNTMTNVIVLQLFDYSTTNKQKTFLSRYGSANTEATAISGRWANNSAISSITLVENSGQTFQTGSTFSLYGIVA